jgi:hypothetical protein
MLRATVRPPARGPVANFFTVCDNFLRHQSAGML